MSGVRRTIGPVPPSSYDRDQAARARPARHVDPRARGSQGRRADGTLPELPTLGEIERRIMRCDDELEQLVEDHYNAAEEAASAEADWKRHRDRCLLAIANADETDDFLKAVGKSADLREAYAKGVRTDPDDLSNPETGDDLYRLYKILEARERSIDRHIRAVQTRATALMSVAKGIRGQT